MDQEKVGKFISSLRKEKNMTQASLGEKLGVSNRSVSKWENGDGMPDVALLKDLADLFGITVDELLSGEKKEIAELKVTEIESKDTTNNWFQITYIVSLFLGVFGAILGFVTLAYNIWAFNILFYNHWEIIFVAVSFSAIILSALFFSIGITKLKLSYNKNEIIKIAGTKGWILGMIISTLPIMFALRIIDVSFLTHYKWAFEILFAIIWIACTILTRRIINEKSN